MVTAAAATTAATAFHSFGHRCDGSACHDHFTRGVSPARQSAQRQRRSSAAAEAQPAPRGGCSPTWPLPSSPGCRFPSSSRSLEESSPRKRRRTPMHPAPAGEEPRGLETSRPLVLSAGSSSSGFRYGRELGADTADEPAKGWWGFETSVTGRAWFALESGDYGAGSPALFHTQASATLPLDGRLASSHAAAQAPTLSRAAMNSGPGLGVLEYTCTKLKSLAP